MAITTTLFNGLGMGLSVTLILICSNVLISLLQGDPRQHPIAAYVVIISGFVTMVDLLLQVYLPPLSEGLGVFIPLIVVNCIILGRAEAFASKNGVLASAADGLTRDWATPWPWWPCVSSGSFWEGGTFGAGLLNGGEGIRVLPDPYPAMLLILPFGGFLTLGCLIAFSQWLSKALDRRQQGGKLKSERRPQSNECHFSSGHCPGSHSHQQLHFGEVSGHLPLHGCVQKTDTALGMGIAVTFVMALALHGYLGSGLLYPHASGPGVHADCCFHSHHCRHCAGGGDVF